MRSDAALVMQDDGHANWWCRVPRKNSDAHTAAMRTINRNISGSRPIAGRSSAQILVAPASTMENQLGGNSNHSQTCEAGEILLAHSFHTARQNENEAREEHHNFGNSLSGLFPRVGVEELKHSPPSGNTNS
ncbi:MAG: hypothetical protein V4602_11810 [Pseudomonadota bacterium]